MWHSPRFNRIDVLLVVMIMFFLVAAVSILAVHPPHMTKIARRAANLQRIGQAMYIYAQDGDVFPAIAQVRMQNDGLMRVFHPDDRVMRPSTTGIPSPTADLWLLVRANNVEPSHFIGPMTKDEPDPALFPSDFFDFLSAENLSYAYQYQHDPDRRAIGTSSEPDFPVLADANPYIKGGVQRDLLRDRLSGHAGNTKNHRSRHRGQNVLFQDAHVNLEPEAAIGLRGPTHPDLASGRDHIYSVYDDAPGTFIDPGSDAPTPTWCNLGGKSDACLVP